MFGRKPSSGTLRKTHTEPTKPLTVSSPPPPPPPGGSHVVPAEAMASTIKIHNHSVSPNYLRPWSKHEGESSSGSGLAIEGRRILTNSHVVNHHQILQVQRHDRPGKWVARLLSEAIQCDLALLTVDDESFWEGLPLQACTDAIPTLQSTVTAVGYPVGGENLCVTRGVVSRIDLLDYTFLEQAQGERLLVLQIDAASAPLSGAQPARLAVAAALWLTARAAPRGVRPHTRTRPRPRPHPRRQRGRLSLCTIPPARAWRFDSCPSQSTRATQAAPSSTTTVASSAWPSPASTRRITSGDCY